MMQLAIPPFVLVALAFVLLAAGVVGSLIPQVPGAPISLAGIYCYWYATGDPGIVLLAMLTVVAVLTWLIDFAGGAISARVGGASTTTAILAGVAGVVLLFVTGPLGMIVGVALTVFVAEFYRQRDTKRSLKAALVTTAGMLASGIAQAALTGSILLAMLGVAFL